MNNEGYIILSRSILDSEVFASQKLLKIWVWCLCKANHKDRFVALKIGKGERTVKVKRGQFIFGRHKAEEELFIDGSTIYKIMQRLQVLGNISIKSNNQYSVITICNYNTYQDSTKYKVATKEQPSNNQVTSKGQVSNTNKNDKNDKNDKKRDMRKKFIKPTKKEMGAYAKEMNIPITVAVDCWYYYDKLDWKIGKDEKQMKNWKSALSGWWSREKRKGNYVDKDLQIKEGNLHQYSRDNYGEDNIKSLGDILKDKQ